MAQLEKKVNRFLTKAGLIKRKTPYSCSVCDQDNIYFNPLAQKYHRQFYNAGFIHSIYLFETLNIFDYACSNCNAPDRDRLYALYLNDIFSNTDTRTISLLDIAPTENLSQYLLRNIKRENYRTADLMMEGVDDKVDIQDMHIYKTDMWDFVICSHVLEHVKDDSKALQEIFRILKPGGKAILMAPINLGLDKSYESEPNKKYSEEERWRYFGQDDHERLYSKNDFISRIESAGFKLHQLDINHFGATTFTQYGISKKSVLYIGEKI